MMNRLLPGFLTALLLAASALGQGSLTPPGSPLPGGRTLTQIEPRVDVQRTIAPLPFDATHRYIINSPGSYYLTSNLIVTDGMRAILITASDVTLDLNGFRIEQDEVGSGIGIMVAVTAHRCVIRNGNIYRFNQGVASEVGGKGEMARGGRLMGLRVSDGSGGGLTVGESWIVEDCQILDNSGLGIFCGANAIVRNCEAIGNAAGGIRVLDGGTLEGCLATRNNGEYSILAGSGCTITRCTARGNTAQFAVLSVGFGCTVKDCAVFSNTSGTGLFLNNGSTLSHSAIRQNSSSGPSEGISASFGCLIVSCTVSGNTSTFTPASGFNGVGIRATASNVTVRDCVVEGNSGDGIAVVGASQVVSNHCIGNGTGGSGAGIRVTGNFSRVDSNYVTSNPRGIEVTGTVSLIVRNTARGSSGGNNYVIAANNRYGPIVDLSGVVSPAVTGSSAASTLTATGDHAWANFVH